VRSMASYIRQTFVLLNLAELFPVPSESRTMCFGGAGMRDGVSLIASAPVVAAAARKSGPGLVFTKLEKIRPGPNFLDR
jgi:hypothetical protein